MRTRQKYREFTSTKECAASAAKVFAEHGWIWAGVGVPTEQQILETLDTLTADSIRNGYTIETGRLIVDGHTCRHEI